MTVFNQIAIIGIGLIGSSIARAAKETGVCERILLTDASAEVCQRAGSLGLGDVVESVKDCVETADLVLMCTPVGVMSDLARDMAPHLKPGTIVSDVGSVKSAVYDTVHAYLPETVHFIPGHPIAGTEKSGPEAGFSSLFQDRWCILTPPEAEEGGDALAQLTAFWEGLGSKVEIMPIDRHDRVLAITSHLPHLIAFNIVGTAHDLESVTEGEVVKFSAGGFRDFTRIAASDPIMWRDVFLNNKEAVLEMLGRFNEDLTALQRAIRWGEGEQLRAFFERTRGIRKSIVDAGQDTDADDFGRGGPKD
ncbi:MAG: cyclohexadienyl dehydrogenase [Ponticaulis sp.]|nr:cyclohexadienyl dehydrogenase [Ponticaulis sp.]|tara:strand:- start:180 stop:1097 length:918 start_codon:yes stop_codon:yes gene_type:complete